MADLVRICPICPAKAVDLYPVPVQAVFPAAAFGGKLMVIRQPAPPALSIVAAGLAARACGRLAEARPLALYRRVLLVSVIKAPRLGDPLLPLPLVPQEGAWWAVFREAVQRGIVVSSGWKQPDRAWERAVERAADCARLSDPERQFLSIALFAVGAGERIAEQIVAALEGRWHSTTSILTAEATLEASCGRR